MPENSPGQRLSIVHLTHQYPPEEMGGVEIYTRNVATQQARLGHEVTVIVPGIRESNSDPVPVVEDGVTVIRIPLGERSRGRVFAATWGDSTFLKHFLTHVQGADIVHIQHLMGIPAAIGSELTRSGIPYVITLHDYWFPCANAQLVTNYDDTICSGPDSRWHNCGRCMMARANLPQLPLVASALNPLMKNRFRKLKQVFEQAERVIAVSRFVKETYAAHGFGGDHVLALASGIDLASDQPETVQHDSTHERPLHVVYLGSIAQLKGVHVLIEAFNRMPGDSRLTVAGGTEKFPDYSARLLDAVLHPNIKFVGQLSRGTVWDLLGSADIVVLPSLWYEASPLTIGEFFAAKLPIIASDIGAISEHIRHGVDGLLFPPGDANALYHAMKQLYDDRELLTALGNNAPDVTTVVTHTQNLQAIYAEVLNNYRDITAPNINLPST